MLFCRKTALLIFSDTLERSVRRVVRTGCAVVKNPSASVGVVRDAGSIPGSGRSPREGYGNPLQYSCLENPMDRGVWQATVRRVAKSQTQLKRLSTHRPQLRSLKGKSPLLYVSNILLLL